MTGEQKTTLRVIIPDHNGFYTLYAHGNTLFKFYDKENKRNVIEYAENAVVFLYYFYPVHREAEVVRNTPCGDVLLPALSKKVTRLFSCHASKVDKLRRAASWLQTNTNAGAYKRSDAFYIRLEALVNAPGKLDYPALMRLSERTI
jgi:hypothetical protein